MKKSIISFILGLGLVVSTTSCQNNSKNSPEATAAKDTMQVKPPAPVIEKALTASEQKALTPDMVMQALKDGNKRFVNNNLTQRNYPALVKSAAGGQYPEGVILSCIDSRVDVEEVFDKGIGDLFVARVAGNFVNEDMLGSLEYGCKEAGAKLIVVLGHESCGAIKAAIEGVKMGNITAMLQKIKPALTKSQSFKGEKTVENHAYVDEVAKNNIAVTLENIRLKSPILKEMEAKGEIKIVGAYYNINTGEVTFL